MTFFSLLRPSGVVAESVACGLCFNKSIVPRITWSHSYIVKLIRRLSAADAFLSAHNTMLTPLGCCKSQTNMRVYSLALACALEYMITHS